MSIEHLSEIKIQKYLDQQASALSENEFEHLQSCEVCRGVLNDYRRLYSVLKKEDEVSLPNDFAARIMSRIRASESPSTATNPWVIIYSLLGAVSCLLAIWYFVDIKALLQGFSSVSFGKVFPDTSAFSGMTGWILGFGESLYLLIFAGMILAGVGLVDRILAKHKVDKAYFFSV
ncbi:MAG: hypothetical protein AB1483_10515 [Candidatus Zixiibacteriota bacterium]